MWYKCSLQDTLNYSLKSSCKLIVLGGQILISRSRAFRFMLLSMVQSHLCAAHGDRLGSVFFFSRLRIQMTLHLLFTGWGKVVIINPTSKLFSVSWLLHGVNWLPSYRVQYSCILQLVHKLLQSLKIHFFKTFYKVVIYKIDINRLIVHLQIFLLSEVFLG